MFRIECSTFNQLFERNAIFIIERSAIEPVKRNGVILFFNQPFMADRLRRGQQVMLSGRPKMRGMRWEMTHPKVEILDEEATPEGGRILPVYALTEGVNQNQMRRIVRGAIESHTEHLTEVLPEEFRQQQQLPDIHTALPQIHFADSAEALTPQ